MLKSTRANHSGKKVEAGSAGLTRRQVLAGLGASVAAQSWGGFARAQSGPLDVLVIGAGLSGLYSALLLQDMGAKVQVIEGRSRVGGRLFTRFDLPGHPEVGGNTMAAGYGRVLDMARRLKVPLIDYAPRLFSGPPPELVLNGELIRKDQWPTATNNPFADPHRSAAPWELIRKRLAGTNPLSASTDWLLPKSKSLDIPLHDYLRTKQLSAQEIALAYDTNPYFGSSSWDVSALMFLFNLRWIEEQTGMGRQAYAVAGGNQRLPLAMAGALRQEVLLDQDVAAIDSQPQGVEVRTRDGKIFRSKFVICSTPVSKLRDIHITPRLDGAPLRATRSLRYMRNTLVFLVPKKAFWQEDGLSPSMWTNGLLGAVMAQRFADDAKEVTGLVINARGWAADRLDRLGARDAQRAVINEVERLRPAAKGQLEPGGFHSWWLDPFSAGDWAILAPGQVHTLVPGMGAPHGRVHFCGEHLGVSNRGMEAAMESAERAVIQVSEHI